MYIINIYNIVAVCTFGPRGQRGSLDGVRLQAALEHVVPQLHHAVLTPRHKTLESLLQVIYSLSVIMGV